MLFALFLFLCTYAFVFASSFADDKCYKSSQSNSSDSNTTTPLPATSRTTLRNTAELPDTEGLPRHLTDHYTSDQVYSRALQSNSTSSSLSETTSLVVLPTVMGVFYTILVAVVFLESLIIWYFANLELSKYANLGFCRRQLGKLYKCLPYLIILAHWLVFVFIIAQVFLVFVVKDCKDAVHDDNQDGTSKEGVMQEQAEFHIVVTIILWCFIHCIGGRIRRRSYYDAFFYQPEQGGSSRLYNWFCIKCGP